MKYFVLGAFSLGVLPLRHRPRLRRHRLDQPVRHRDSRAADRPFVGDVTTADPRQHAGPAARRLRPAARRLRLQGGGRAVPRLDARRVPGRAPPIVAFMASASRRPASPGCSGCSCSTFEAYRDDWQPVIYALAVATLVVGSVLAVVQTDVKRHAGLHLDQPRRVHPRRRAGGDRHGASAASLFYLPPTRSWWSALRRGHPGRPQGRRRHHASTTTGAWPAPAGAGVRFTVFLLAQAGRAAHRRVLRQVLGDRRRRRRRQLLAGHRGHGLGRHRRVPLPADHRGHVHGATSRRGRPRPADLDGRRVPVRRRASASPSPLAVTAARRLPARLARRPRPTTPVPLVGDRRRRGPRTVMRRIRRPRSTAFGGS